MRRCEAWLEWQWNHIFQHVGSNQSDLLNTIGPKLNKSDRAGLAHLVLVVGGGHGLSQVLAPMMVEHLVQYTGLGRQLKNGPFDEVALLGLRRFLWRRHDGWSDLA